jgi:hypothetical protein
MDQIVSEMFNNWVDFTPITNNEKDIIVYKKKLAGAFAEIKG